MVESKEKNVECKGPNSMVTATEAIGKESNPEVTSLASESDENNDIFYSFGTPKTNYPGGTHKYRIKQDYEYSL